MKNRYKVTGHRPVEGAAPGEELEAEFNAEQEHNHLAAGRLEILPRAYRVCGPRKLSGPGYEAGPNDVFEAALTVGEEASLTEAGHIERYGKKTAKDAKAEPQANKQKEG